MDVFTPLAVRSHYSLMRGTASVKALARRAGELGYSRLALTDRDNLYGLWFFIRACLAENIRPLTGAEVTQPPPQGTPEHQDDGLGPLRPYKRAVCLAESEEGFRNLCRLLTRRHREENFDLARAVVDLGQGLALLSDDPGLLEYWHGQGLTPRALLAGRPDSRGLELRALARRLGIPAVAAPDSYLLEPRDRPVQRVLAAISRNTSLSRLGPAELAPDWAWLAGPEEYVRRFAPWPEAVRAARELAERLEFVPRPGVVMPPWESGDDSSPAQVLRRTAFEGAAECYGRPLPAEVSARLERELAVIEQKNFSSYFLVVQDIVARSPRICGRGSGAASIVAYCLGITNVCPIKFNLYFERFINPARQDPPDIDVDFAWDERDGVINSVLEQYSGRAAMVATHIGFRGKMAIREVAKVWGIPEPEIKQTMRSLPWLRAPRETDTGLHMKTEALPSDLKPAERAALARPWPDILALAQRLIKTPRHISVHVGGVVITPGPIDGYAPIQTAAKGVPIIQWEIDGAEDAGLVKIDLLGNRSLGVIRDAIADVKADGLPFREPGWEPEDDPTTQALVARGRTMGCFYIESPATRLLQAKAGRGDYEHLVIHSSIIRPAANDWIQEYLRRLKGGAWQPIHPRLEAVLAETYGIMVYQEHVSQAAVAVAGFSHAQADQLRKVMTKKDRETEVADYRGRFFRGAREQGLSREQIETIWSMMLSFSGYSFCKPHSASYARVSFQAAYLKTHFPAQFMAAVISNQGGFYSPFAYISEARRLGLRVLPPDVNASRIKYTGYRAGKEGRIRVGLMAVKDLGAETMVRIIDRRQERPFASLADLIGRVRPADDEIRALIHAGACDSLNPADERAALVWQLARERQRAEAAAEEMIQPSLFSAQEPVAAPDLPPGLELARLRRQFRALGFLPDRHPIVLFQKALTKKMAARPLAKAVQLPRLVGKRVALAGWLITAKTVRTSKDEPMQFTTFEDETGLIETTLFPKTFRSYHLRLEWGRPYILKGLVEENFGAVTLTVDKIEEVKYGAGAKEDEGRQRPEAA